MDLLNLKRVKDEIINDYENILKLPKEEKEQILKRLYIINEIQKRNYRYEVLSKSQRRKEALQEIQNINNLVQELNKSINTDIENDKPIVNRTRQTPNIKERIFLVINFMRSHIQRVGIEQAVRDFQYGLNLLTNKRKDSRIEAFNQLKEDGDFGNKTYTCLANICKYYTPRIICKNIQKAAITNAIFDTKNDKRINTQNKIEQIKNDLKPERIL